MNTRISKGHTTYRRHKSLFLGIAAIFPVFQVVVSQDISDYSLEDLASIPVVESSKQTERLFDTPASAFVFDEDAIEYLPVDSVPEMLRYAPGVSITRATNGIWGLGIRGMSSRFLGRVLFTVDEQNIFSTLYAGLFGSQHDLLMSDISSVEVVYGPGGTLWGTNAANGMVNVIMKSAFETEDTIMLARTGSMNQQVGARTGFSISEDTSARVFAKYNERAASESPFFDDSWVSKRIGFQMDHRLSSRDLLTFSGEWYDSDLGWAQQFAWQETGQIGLLEKPEKQTGFNLQGKWTHQEDTLNGFTLRGWAGSTNMDSGYVEFDLNLYGTELRYRYSPADKHQFIFTAGGTLEHYDLKNTRYSTFHNDYEKDSYTAHLGTEYTYAIKPQKLDLTLGLSYDYSSHTESDSFLPSARLLYRPNDRTRLWASFSRAARPVVAGMNDVKEILFSIFPIDPVSIPTPIGEITLDKQLVYGTSNRDIEPEKLHAFELGLRHQLNARISFRVNAYHYEYTDAISGVLEGSEPVLTVPSPYIKTYYRIANVGEGVSDGFEISADLSVGDKSNLIFSFATNKDDFDPTVLPEDIVGQVFVRRSLDMIANSDPSNIMSTWWVQKWGETLRTDLGLRYTNGYTNNYGTRDAILQADLKASWEPSDQFRISLVGRNLLQDYTSEAPLRDMLSIPTEQPREWYLEVRYQF